MSTVTVYTFEDADGTEDTYTTQSAIEAKDRGQRERMRVIANEYEWTDSEMAWDFTPPGDQHEALAMMQGAEPECRRCADHDPRDRRDHGHIPDEILNREPTRDSEGRPLTVGEALRDALRDHPERP